MPGLIVINDKEREALSCLLTSLAKLHGEDVIGIILKHTGHLLLNGAGIVELANKIEEPAPEVARPTGDMCSPENVAGLMAKLAAAEMRTEKAEDACTRVFADLKSEVDKLHGEYVALVERAEKAEAFNEYDQVYRHARKIGEPFNASKELKTLLDQFVIIELTDFPSDAAESRLLALRSMRHLQLWMTEGGPEPHVLLAKGLYDVITD